MSKNRKGAELLAQIQGSKNVRATCKKLGISRSQYYKLLQNAEPAPARTYTPSKMGQDVADKIKELALLFPFGCHNISYKLMEENTKLSAVSVQKVLNQFQLGSASERYKALEKTILESKEYLLNPEQKEFLSRHNPALLEHHRKAQAPGELITIFSCFLGQLPWLGKVYIYFALDAYSGYVQTMLCYAPDKYLCANFLIKTVFPFYEQQGIKIKRVETSDDPEFFSYSTHPFSSFLRNLSDVKYQRTTVGGLKTNGYSQKWHQYLQGQIIPRLKQDKGKYLELESMDDDLQKILKIYNESSSEAARSHFMAYPFESRSPISALKQG